MKDWVKNWDGGLPQRKVLQLDQNHLHDRVQISKQFGRKHAANQSGQHSI
ncbi:hypothetical protein RESH_00816 [Rhodopirellula europaea SH398]|uniref:Uncharacterized protein n=1 Tax=Rhodopirellula europaea SH398 TaxID=1263868 RepID=M5SAT5_9BACT|nr:hypothetical protein RESH_00816 [Rhodopirellula europaea SH398]